MITAHQPSKRFQNVKIPDNTPPFVVRILVTLLLIVAIFGVSVAISLYSKEFNTPSPTNFERCKITIGSIIQESYPEICVTKKGQRFVREISDDEKKLLEAPIDQNTDYKFCGGIAGLLCLEGYRCKLDGNYPDASGICIQN